MPPPAEGIASRLILGPALRAQSDRRLVTLVREGYESAFEEIVRRYGRPLGRYAAAIVGGRSEDVTQDAFSKALLAMRRDDAEIELRPWLFRIVRNTALNDLRDSPPAPEVLAEAVAAGRSAAEEAEQRAELTDLIERLQALPEAQRAAIVMRELEGLSHEEIAAALGVTGGAARQAIHRARRALRNGAGMLIPLPLLKAMFTGAAAPGAAEAAVGAAGVGSATGAGVALKATAATVLVAGAVGTGVAINYNANSGDARATPSHQSQSDPAGPAGAPAVVPDAGGSGGEDGHGGGGDDGSHRGRGEGERGDDHGGHGDERGDDHGGRSSHEGRGDGDAAEDHSGPSGSSGPGSGSSGSDGGDDGSKPSGSGSSGSGKGSGSGSGGPGPSSGSGSGGSGSGSGGGSEPSEESSGSGGGPG
jgi:RNA polymerase sigma factor (sigma-70 family)